MARVNTLLFLVTVALTVVAVIDCLATERARVRRFPRAAWLALVVCCPVAGAVAWFRAGRAGAGHLVAARVAPIGPEDDPEFVRRLAETIRGH